MPGAVLNELCNHARDVVPEECCGLVAGRDDDRFRRVYRITNVMTRMHLADPKTFPRDAHHAYYMLESEYLTALRDAERGGERITGVYHSHVGTGVYLSTEDLAYAQHPLFPFPEAVQIVISILGDRVQAVGLFELDARTGHFDLRGGRLVHSPRAGMRAGGDGT